jgi:hypothetical protein
MDDRGAPLVRVVDGELTDSELAALAAVLLARATGHRAAADRPAGRARWGAPELLPRYRSPGSWQ